MVRRRLIQKYRRFKHLTLKVPYFEIRPTDGFLCSFPRSGNTWVRYMLVHALHPHRDWELSEIEDLMPIVNRRDLPNSLPRMDDQPCRLFKSHEQFIDHYLVGRTVYIVRDGRDAMVSFHHYHTRRKGNVISLSDYVRRSLAGRYQYGSWPDHVRGWLQHADHPNVCVIRYEHMLEDAERQLRRVLEHFELDVPADDVAAAVRKASLQRVYRGFRRQAARKNKFYSGGLGGGSGKGKRMMDPQTLRMFMAEAGDLMRELGYAV